LLSKVRTVSYERQASLNVYKIGFRASFGRSLSMHVSELSACGNSSGNLLANFTGTDEFHSGNRYTVVVVDDYHSDPYTVTLLSPPTSGRIVRPLPRHVRRG